ncbi:hypothetical protein ACJJTC_017257 [Scirpophaga incertulas]
MLISGLTGDGAGESEKITPIGDHDPDFRYRSSRSYDVTMDVNRHGNSGDTLIANDLVILFKNIDVQTKSTNDINRTKTCNQYVEQFIYNDERDSDCSVCYDIYSNKDLVDLVLINNDRMDFLNSPSFSHTLCHKLGDLELHRSAVYSKCNDSFFKDQFAGYNIFKYSTSELYKPVFASLLDYISFDEIETNSDFYMESIIKYAIHTIDQLKRISNGDYLTDKAKEKWKQVEKKHDINRNMVLAVSTKIPLSIDQNASNRSWSNAHTQIDIKYISNISQKEVRIQIPKEINTPFKLLSKLYFSDPPTNSKRTLLNQVKKTNEESKHCLVQLNHSVVPKQSINDAKAVVVFETNVISQLDNLITAIIPMSCWQLNNSNEHRNEVKIVEIQDKEQDFADNNTNYRNVIDTESNNTTLTNIETFDTHGGKNCSENWDDVIESKDAENETLSFMFGSDVLATNETPKAESDFSCTLSNDLPSSLKSINMDCLPEESIEDITRFPESVERKSANKKIRVKSPYENKSHILEEKKRKKLLEIRERREKKKMAMNENSRIRKHKFSKGPIMPQYSNSVTKLSITNKSFYNSIYGQNTHVDDITAKQIVRKEKKNSLIDQTSLEKLENNKILSNVFCLNSRDNLYQNCFLDDPMTEIMNTQQSERSSLSCDTFSEPNSPESNKSKTGIIRVKQSTAKNSKGVGAKEILNNVTRSNHHLKPALKTQKENEFNDSNLKKIKTVEFKKSIDKIYNLINKTNTNEFKNKMNLQVNNSNNIYTTDGMSDNNLSSSTPYCTDSGTSLKHRLTSSNHSIFSFGKARNTEEKNTSIFPKVIINSKQQPKNDPDVLKKGRKKVSLNTFPEDPQNSIKAISHLLCELESKQKINRKTSDECKSHSKKAEISFEGRAPARRVTLAGRSRLELSPKSNLHTEKTVKSFVRKDHKLLVVNERTKLMQRHPHVEEKRLDKFYTRKLSDIIDEAKEAKGEAVRGPLKWNSRLDNLAQPKKSYVQTHNAEYLNRRGRNLMTDRSQKLAGTPDQSKVHGKLDMAGGKVMLKKNTVAADVPPTSPAVTETSHLEREVHFRRPVPISSLRKQIVLEMKERLHFDMKRNIKAETRTNINQEQYMPERPIRNCTEQLSVGDTMDNKLQRIVSKARIPLIPENISIGSNQSSPTEDSTVLGKKIHNIVNKLIKSNSKHIIANMPKRSSTDTEISNDITCKNLNKVRINGNNFKQDNSITDTFSDDIFDDNKLQTAIQHISSDDQSERFVDVKPNNCSVKINEAAPEIKLLENGLHHQISTGSFQKRLKLKNFTLTPKQSQQNVLILQSGDDGSVLLTSKLSNYFNLNRLDMNSEEVSIISAITQRKMEPIVSTLPLNIMTIGYAFSQRNNNTPECNPNIPNRVSTINKNTDLQSNEIKTENLMPPNESVNIKSTAYETALQDVSRPVKAPSLIDEQEVSLNDTMSHLKINNSAIPTKCTSSLDVLVSLLNEIQNITEYHISNHTDREPKLLNDTLKINNDDNNESPELVSITSLDKLRQLDSSQSIYSLYISNDECETAVDNNRTSDFITDFRNIICGGNDKEISANFHPDKEVVDVFTSISIKQLPVTSHGTSITDSLEGILSKPSSHMFLLADQQSCVNNSSSVTKNKIIEILGDASEPKINNKLKKLKTFGKPIITNMSLGKKYKVKSKFADSNDIQIAKKVCIYSVDNDPLFKMKRDILVTMYSMLVITVFAALSVPNMFYYTL